MGGLFFVTIFRAVEFGKIQDERGFLDRFLQLFNAFFWPGDRIPDPRTESRLWTFGSFPANMEPGHFNFSQTYLTPYLHKALFGLESILYIKDNATTISGLDYSSADMPCLGEEGGLIVDRPHKISRENLFQPRLNLATAPCSSSLSKWSQPVWCGAQFLHAASWDRPL